MNIRDFPLTKNNLLALNILNCLIDLPKKFPSLEGRTFIQHVSCLHEELGLQRYLKIHPIINITNQLTTLLLNMRFELHNPKEIGVVITHETIDKADEGLSWVKENRYADILDGISIDIAIRSLRKMSDTFKYRRQRYVNMMHLQNLQSSYRSKEEFDLKNSYFDFRSDDMVADQQKFEEVKEKMMRLIRPFSQ